MHDLKLRRHLLGLVGVDGGVGGGWMAPSYRRTVERAKEREDSDKKTRLDSVEVRVRLLDLAKRVADLVRGRRHLRQHVRKVMVLVYGEVELWNGMRRADEVIDSTSHLAAREEASVLGRADVVDHRASPPVLLEVVYG